MPLAEIESWIEARLRKVRQWMTMCTEKTWNRLTQNAVVMDERGVLRINVRRARFTRRLQGLPGRPGATSVISA
jgi:hypothetical protein